MDNFVARQPIFDRDQKAFAYELLFRTSLENRFPVGSDLDYASAKIIADSIDVFGLETLASGKRLFINVTHRVLVEEHIRLLPPKLAVVELLETIEPDAAAVAACARLKEEGYTLALDDFVFRPGYEPLMALADIVKVDFLATRGPARRELGDRFAKGVRLLAEKVENQEDVAEARGMGYAYFQGHFFCRPQIIAAKAVPAFKVNYLRLLQALNSGEFELERIETVIKQEMSLTVKLLRYLNSAMFAWRSRVTTIRQALVLLGERQFRKWASVVAISGLGSDKPEELVRVSLVRAGFCEKLRPLGVDEPELELFLTGLLTTIDAMLDRPMGEILDSMAVQPAVRAALLEGKGRLGLVRDLALAFERGAWDDVCLSARQLGLDEVTLGNGFAEALQWADRVLAATA